MIGTRYTTPRDTEPPRDELEQEIQEINEEIRAARLRKDHLSVKSLLLARRDLRLAKQKEISEGTTLEDRFSAFCDDGELQIYALDQMTNGRGWNKANPTWWDRKLAKEAADHAQKHAAEERRRR
jgi:hypothetical protein